MKNNLNIRSFLKFLSKNKFYTFVELFGLSVSLMFVILIGVYVVQEFSVDQYQENKDHIYLLSDGETFDTANQLGYTLLDRYPEVEQVCHIIGQTIKNPVEIAGQKLYLDITITDTTFFNMFSFPFIYGKKENVMASRNYAVITESFARQAFPDIDPIGQQIRIKDSVNIIVNGVIRDIKNSVIPQTDILLRIDNAKYFNWNLDSDGYINAGGAILFVKEHIGADLRSKEEDVANYFSEFYWYYRDYKDKKAIFVPLKEVYFSEYSTYHETINRGDRMFVLILLSVGILILLFAVINYINLTVAQTGLRAKEIAIRSLLGSSKTMVFLRMITESTTITFVSFLFSIFLAFLCTPFANQLLNTTLYLSDFITPLNALICFGLIILIGCLNGILPAAIISNSDLIDVVKGTFRQKNKMVFSKFFITFQNAITISLIAASIIMFTQANYMIHAPLGYNTTNIIDINTQELENEELAKTLKNELEQLACVKRIGNSFGTPLDALWNAAFKYENNNYNALILYIDTIYFNMLGLEITQENNLASSDKYYLTESSYQRMGLSDDIMLIKSDGWEFPIAGKIKDFHPGDITRKDRDIFVKKFDNLHISTLSIETQGEPYEAYQQIKDVYENLCGIPFTGQFVEQKLYERFESQRQMAKIVIVFSIIAVIISLLGLLAISTYFIQQRTREIAVRKVFGSSNIKILQRLITTFLMYVVIAFVITTPVTWHIMRKWLQSYSYRIEISPLFFVIAGISCLFLSFVTVFWQSYRAANLNPALSIKDE